MLRWCAAVAWITLLLSVGLLWGQDRAGVLHPLALLFLSLLALTVLAGLAGGSYGLWRVLRGPKRLAALGWGVAAFFPLACWLALARYELTLVGKGDFPLNVWTRVARMAIASAMEVGAAYSYPHRLESERLVMFYDDRLIAPQRDLDEMEKHVARLEALTGKPLRAKIHWVRGVLLGQTRLALYGLALGSPQSPRDWQSAGHPDGLSVDRHELAHAVLHQQQPPDADPPFLLIEGWADAQSGTTPPKRAEWAKQSRELWRARVGAGPAASYLRELTGPEWYHHIDGPVYNVGGAFAEFLLDRYGAERFLQLYFACRPGQFEEALRTHFGADLDTLEPEFWAWVERTTPG